MNDLIKAYNEALEGDTDFNEESRQTIVACWGKWGKCYLGKIDNFEGFQEYNGQAICNFEADFCLPQPDGKLERMLNDWNNPDDFLTKEAIASALAICIRVKEAGGELLLWV